MWSRSLSHAKLFLKPLPSSVTLVKGTVVGFVITGWPFAAHELAIGDGIGAACPLVAPSAPEKVAKKLSKLRFSWIMTTTCWMCELPFFRCGASGSRLAAPPDDVPPPHAAMATPAT